MNTSFVKSEVKASPSRSPHLREYKTVLFLDSMPWIPHSKAQDRQFLHQNSKIPDSGFGFPCMARALGFRQIHLIAVRLFLLEDEDELLKSIAKSSALLQDG